MPSPLKLHANHIPTKAALDKGIDNDSLIQKNIGINRNVRILSICLLLRFTPLLILARTLGVSSIFLQQGIFFSKMAVVTFGGAYAVLSYVAQQAVNHYNWLLPGEMLDGLGMAETTPGPLIQVVQFVSFIGAYRYPGTFAPLTAGIMASLPVTWVTFIPCFLWIFLGAPYVEKLRTNTHLTNIFSAITAAVVGAILNLVLWFSLHVIFHDIREWHGYGMKLSLSIWTSIDLAALILTSGAIATMFLFRTSIIFTIVGCVVLGSAYQLLF